MCVALSMALYAALPTTQAQTAAATESVRQYDIPAGTLSTALGAWGAQSDRQLVFAPDLVAGKRSRGVSGRYGAERALTQVLAGTGLTWERVNGQTYTLKRPPPANANQRRTPKPKAPTSTAAQKIAELSTVSVTGTRIRGGTTASPTITIGAQRIRNEGFGDLGQVIRSIPQNFKGGQNPEVPTGNLGLGLINQNDTGGSGLNLRGLGPDATLTLLNGKRLAYSGFLQAIDVSMIPVEAVDRIEVVPDGASAIYGSDAVGGVGNVILKHDYEGVTLGTRYGAASNGGLASREYAVTAGTTWSNGGLLAAYTKASNTPINADERAYTRYMPNPTTVYPSIRSRTGLISVHQSLGDIAEAHLDALASTRRQVSSYFLNTLPEYYVSTPDTKTTWISPGIQFYLAKDWTLSVGATWGKDKYVFRQALKAIPTGVSTPLYDYCFCNDLRTYEVDAEGSLFPLPGGDARLAVGVGYRSNEFRQVVALGSGMRDVQGSENNRFAYVEVGLPLIGSGSDITGVRRLEITGAARTEEYNSFGHIVTPQFGIIYGPSEDFSLKGSWGKSFKAPTLYQKSSAVTALLYPATRFGAAGYPANATAIYLTGGNRNLKPERARTWTASLEFHPEALPNLQVELTRFDIDYTNRVLSPITNPIQGLSNQAYAPFVEHSPTAESQEQVLGDADSFLNVAGVAYDPGNVVAILHNQSTNVSRQRIKGIDLSGTYQFDFDAGRLNVRGSASWLDSSQKVGSGQGDIELAGTLFNPAKITSRFGAIWSRGGFTASAFANYTSGVRDMVNKENGGSFTTFDMTLRYVTGKDGGAFSGVEVALSAQNLFDRDPPFYTPASRIYMEPYDPTNYSAIGRFLNLSVSKHW